MELLSWDRDNLRSSDEAITKVHHVMIRHAAVMNIPAAKVISGRQAAIAGRLPFVPNDLCLSVQATPGLRSRIYFFVKFELLSIFLQQS